MRSTLLALLLTLTLPFLTLAWTDPADGREIYIRDAEAAQGPAQVVNGFEGFADPGAGAAADDGADGDGAFAD